MEGWRNQGWRNQGGGVGGGIGGWGVEGWRSQGGGGIRHSICGMLITTYFNKKISHRLHAR